ncbi:DUF309 domain-containing protein [Mobilicoccus caccae]|uniref:DUF309 domain-containing protein n=1 Tax=Mobilicoccus caccae TaxID=1859295 RepID=A0ABQ6IRD6_9MICO|nr:DUF309 domain-containing protein [Mobilicoccus caccae]GMA40024.1 hypothetical protein GCM10025883_20690 [Mobilicoccus caccae]
MSDDRDENATEDEIEDDGAGVDRQERASTGRARRRARDRDEEGRARQARPRDALGRPLPYGATGVEPVDETPLPPERTIEVARGLLAAGRPFSAHEIYETRWKSCPQAERDLWKGLAQLCVAITHGARGNTTGARRLLGRGEERLGQYGRSGGPRYGLDLVALVDEARSLVETRSAGG